MNYNPLTNNIQNNLATQRKLHTYTSLNTLKPIVQQTAECYNFDIEKTQEQQKNFKKLYPSYSEKSLSFTSLFTQKSQNLTNNCETLLNFDQNNNFIKPLQQKEVIKLQLQKNRQQQYLHFKQKKSTNNKMESNQKKQYNYYFKKDSSSNKSITDSGQKNPSDRYVRYQKYEESKKKGRQSSNPSIQDNNLQKSRASLPLQNQKRSSLYASRFDTTSILQKNGNNEIQDMSKSSHVKFMLPTNFGNTPSIQENNQRYNKNDYSVGEFSISEISDKNRFQQSQVSVESQQNINKGSQYQNLRQPRQMTVVNPISNFDAFPKDPILQKHSISQKYQVIKNQTLNQQQNKSQTISVASSQQIYLQKSLNYHSIDQLKRDYQLLMVNYKKQKQQKQLLQNKRKNHLDQILRQQNYIKQLQAIQQKYTNTTKQYQNQISNLTYIIEKMENQNKNLKSDNERLMNNFQERLQNSMIKQTSTSQEKIKQYENKIQNYLKQMHKLNTKLEEVKIQSLQTQVKLKGNFQQSVHEIRQSSMQQVKKLKQTQNNDLSNLAKYYQERQKKIVIQWEKKFLNEKQHHQNIIVELRQSNFLQIERLTNLRNLAQQKSQQRQKLILQAKNQQLKRLQQSKTKQIQLLSTKIKDLANKLQNIDQIHKQQKTDISQQLQKQRQLSIELKNKIKILQSSSLLQVQQIKTYKLYCDNLKKQIKANKQNQIKLSEDLLSAQNKIKDLDSQNLKTKNSFKEMEQLCNSIRLQLLQTKQLLKKSQKSYKTLKIQSPKKQMQQQKTLRQKQAQWKETQQKWKLQQQNWIIIQKQLNLKIFQLSNQLTLRTQQQNRKAKDLEDKVNQLQIYLQKNDNLLTLEKQISDLKDIQQSLRKQNKQLFQNVQLLNQQLKDIRQTQQQLKVENIQEEINVKQVQQQKNEQNQQKQLKGYKKKIQELQVQIISHQNAIQALHIVISGKTHQFQIISEDLVTKKCAIQASNEKIRQLQTKIQQLDVQRQQSKEKSIKLEQKLASYQTKQKQNVIDEQDQILKAESTHEYIQTQQTNLDKIRDQKNQQCMELYEQLQYKESVIKQLQSELSQTILITKSLKAKLQEYQSTPGNQTDRSLQQFLRPVQIVSLKQLKIKQFYSKVQEYYNQVLEVFGLDDIDFNKIQQIIKEQHQQKSQNSLTKMQGETAQNNDEVNQQKTVRFQNKIHQISQNQQELLRLINQWIKKLQKQALTITQHQQKSQFMQQKINVLNNENQELSLQKIEIYEKYEGFISKLQTENQDYQQKLNELAHKLFECQTFCGQLQAILHDTNAELLKYTIFGVNIAKNNQIALDDILIQNHPYLQEFELQHQKYLTSKVQSPSKKQPQINTVAEGASQSIVSKRQRAQSLTDSLHIQDQQKMDEQTLNKQLSQNNIINSDSSQEDQSQYIQPQQQYQNQNDCKDEILQLQKKAEQMANNSLQELLKKIQAIQKKISSSKKIIPKQLSEQEEVEVQQKQNKKITQVSLQNNKLGQQQQTSESTQKQRLAQEKQQNYQQQQQQLESQSQQYSQQGYVDLNQQIAEMESDPNKNQ